MRVAAYWEARREGDLALVYEFYADGFKRVTPRADFLRNYGRLTRFVPAKVKIQSIELGAGGDEACVTVRLTLTKDIEGVSVVLDALSLETWVRQDDAWFKKDEPFVPNI